MTSSAAVPVTSTPGPAGHPQGQDAGQHGRGTGTSGRLAGVPRWAWLAAHAVPLAVLPSSLWRVVLLLGVPVIVPPMDVTFWETIYVLGLSVVSESLALLTLGLVQPWGEVVPRWVPLLGGRRVATWAAVTAASAGAVATTAIWGYALVGLLADDLSEIGTPLQQWVAIGSYAPLLAWGPLLGAVTIAYARRRARHPR